MTRPHSSDAPTGHLVTEDVPGRRVVRALKVYDEVRTAHLERVADRRTTILYRRRRYDFDERLARSRDVQQAGVLRTLRWALRHPVDVIEVAEPFVLGAAPRSLAAIAGNRLRAAFGRGPRARVVAYAIESLHPDDVSPRLPGRTRLKRRGQSMLVPLVWRSLDRLVLGTEVAQSVYRRSFRSRWPKHQLIPALPVSRLTGANERDRGRSLVFLGDLSERKGFPQLLDAWPDVRARVPGARLSILGRGAGEPAAVALAAADEAVTVTIDPPRETIFAALGASKVLVLPSQRTPRWREQVGLPIVEGLSLGCAIVTTTETGIADWLAAHGHGVVAPRDADALRDAIVAALEGARSPADIAAQLPSVDGRAAAEAWLFEGAR